MYPDSEPNTDVADLDGTHEVVRGYPPLLVLGTVCIPTIYPQIVGELDALAGAGDIIGIKLYPGFELFYPHDQRCLAVYELCIRHDMPVVFHSGETMGQPWREEYSHPREIAQMAERFPALRVIVAHFSQPHLAACRDLVLNHANVYADISGLAHPHVIACCGREAIARELGAVVAQQPEKVLFGTDWPICDVGAHLQLVASLPISDRAKNLILSGNAERVFALKLGQ